MNENNCHKFRVFDNDLGKYLDPEGLVITADGELCRVSFFDLDTAAGRGKGEVANTIREAMPAMTYLCKCLADLIPKPVTKEADRDEQR